MAKKATTAPSEIEENPDWLHSDPEGAAPSPPTVTRAQNLPFTELEWRDFERLCRRLSLRRGNVEHALAYGTPGQAQYGIDILVRFADGAYEVWQTKRYKAMQPPELKAAVSLFLSHRWKDKARKFVLAVACNLDATGVVDAIEKARDLLASESIGFEPLDGTELSKLLVEEPEIVDDYFGRAWVEALCPPEAREVLAKRLSRFDITSLRRRLKDWYTAWVATVDPGLPVADLGRSGHTVPAIPIRDRYVRPDVLERVIEYEPPPAPQSTGNPSSGGDRSGGESATARANASPQLQSTRPASAPARERRVDLDKFLLGARRTIITADAGMGKSTLLRVIALDVLADEPEFEFIREHCTGYVPVWVPFALWTRMASGQPAPPPLADAVVAFFRAQSEPELGEQVAKILDTGKALLLVDGLDEASDTTAARTVVTGLATFVEAHPTFVIATSRPHGLRAIGGVATSWIRVDLAPLSDEQRHMLARLWFHVIADLETDGQADVSRLQADRRATALTEALKRTPAIARLSQTPLFLLALMQLHRYQQQLPRSRFAAIAKIVDQLVEHQPRRREAEALSTATSALRPNLRDRLLEDFAFALHAGELPGPVTDAAIEESALRRATAFVMQRQGSQDLDKSEEVARSVLVFAEERAGLLVKKASETIGFLHLSIQEFLSARYLAQRPFTDRLKFVREYAEQLRWREPILYLIFLETNEGQVGQFLRAIEQAAITTQQGQHLRDALLTDAVFADFAHDQTVAREIAGRLFDEAELTASGARQRHILTSGVDGLGSETVASLCAARIRCWLPNRHGYHRSSAIYAMQRWPASSHEACTRALLRLLAADEETTRRAAAEVLPLLARPGGNTKEELKSLLKAAPSVDVVASTLYALGCGWAGDSDVAALAADARSSSDPAVERQALRIRAMRKETDELDFQRFLKLNYSERPIIGHMAGRGLIEHFAETRRAEFINWLTNRIESKYDRNPHDLMPLIGSLILCDPQHPLVTPIMTDLLANDWIMREVFAEQGFPADRITWTPELDARIENFATGKNGRFSEYEFYWIARVRPLPTLKAQILRNLDSEGSLRFWSARALVDVWGTDDPETKAALLPFLERPANDLASVADVLPAVCNDNDLCRTAFIRALRDRPNRSEMILRRLRKLGVTMDDDEAFEASLASQNERWGPLFHDQWREEMFLLFPSRPSVRDMALKELYRHDGSVGAVAISYAEDAKIVDELLRVLTPLPTPERLVVLSALQGVAVADDGAVALLDASREDTESAVLTEATIQWMEALVGRNAVSEEQIEAMVMDLDAVGPDFGARRLTAVVALVAAGHVDRFARAIGRKGEPLDIAVGGRTMLRESERIVGHLLRYWVPLASGLGGDEAVMRRLGLSPDALLPQLSPNEPNARAVFELLIKDAQTDPSVGKYIQMNALAKFSPQCDALRAMILARLTGPTRGDYWDGLIAGEIFAEQFATDCEMRTAVVASFERQPYNFAATAALAELLVYNNDTDLEALLRRKATGTNYDVATHFKLVAALSSPDKVVAALRQLLANLPIELYELQLPRWIPALTRRIEHDTELQSALLQALVSDTPSSIKASFVSLLAQAVGPSPALTEYVSAELRRANTAPFPEIGFDLGSQTNRVVAHLLTETLA